MSSLIELNKMANDLPDSLSGPLLTRLAVFTEDIYQKRPIYYYMASQDTLKYGFITAPFVSPSSPERQSMVRDCQSRVTLMTDWLETTFKKDLTPT